MVTEFEDTIIEWSESKAILYQRIYMYIESGCARDGILLFRPKNFASKEVLSSKYAKAEDFRCFHW